MLLKTDRIRLLDSKETSTLLRVSERWLKFNRTMDNRIPFIKVGRKIYYDENDLISWLKKQKVKDMSK